MRICNKCKQEKTLDSFHKVKSFPLGRAYTCKPCARQRAVEWNRENKERKKQQGKKHYRDNKEVYLERATKSTWSKDNKERVRELSKIRYKRSAGAAKVAYYRNLRKQATPNWLSEEDKKEIENMYWLCRDLESFSDYKYHVDHIVPIKGSNVCGLHVPWNLQILPEDLNIKKSNTFGY